MIHELISYTYSSNSFILTGDKNILIDPGLPVNPALEKFQYQTPTDIDIIIDTHCHYDHVGGNFGENVYVHEDDAEAVEKGLEKTVYQHHIDSYPGHPVAKRLKEGDIIDIGEHALEVIHTPGHTSGSICLLDKVSGTLFSGDTIFDNWVGRTDLPSGSITALEASVKKLAKLDITHVCPGHGPVFDGNINRIIRLFFGR